MSRYFLCFLLLTLYFQLFTCSLLPYEITAKLLFLYYSYYNNILYNILNIKLFHRVKNDGIELLQFVSQIVGEISRLDFKLKAQLIDSVQSISANIAEGYCRKSINEYLYFLNVALGSCGEVLTRSIGLKTINLISEKNFEEIDKLHYGVVNKLLGLIIKALESKRNEGTWDNRIHDSSETYSTTP